MWCSTCSTSGPGRPGRARTVRARGWLPRLRGPVLLGRGTAAAPDRGTLPASGRRVELWCLARRLEFGEPACRRRSFTPPTVQIPARARATKQLREGAATAIERWNRPVSPTSTCGGGRCLPPSALRDPCDRFQAHSRQAGHASTDCAARLQHLPLAPRNSSSRPARSSMTTSASRRSVQACRSSTIGGADRRSSTPRPKDRVLSRELSMTGTRRVLRDVVRPPRESREVSWASLADARRVDCGDRAGRQLSPAPASVPETAGPACQTRASGASPPPLLDGRSAAGMSRGPPGPSQADKCLP